MNTNRFNSAPFNGKAVVGKNATLTDGVSGTSVISALLVANAILVGGLFSVSDAQGSVSQKLLGGMSSNCFMNAGWQQDLFLSGSISSSCFVAGDMNSDPSLRDGIQSPSDWGGTIIADALLQPDDQVGQSSVVGGGMAAGHILTGGVDTTSITGGGIQGSIVLVSGGLVSTSVCDSPDIKHGRQLDDGVSSSCSVGGTTKWPANLTGSIFSNAELGYQIKINALLQGSLYHVGDMGGTILLDAPLQDGIQKNNFIDSKILVSPNLLDGIYADTTFSGAITTAVRMQDGMGSNSFFDGPEIIGSTVLSGGINAETGDSFDADLLSNALLQGIVSSTNSLSADIVVSFSDPRLNTWALEIKSATVVLELRHPLSDI